MFAICRAISLSTGTQSGSLGVLVRRTQGSRQQVLAQPFSLTSATLALSWSNRCRALRR